MYYFIPSWYGTERFWHAEIPLWYRVISKIEFDDLIHQLRIFQEEVIPRRMLLLAYSPHVRYFLHRQDIFETAYYSVFDDIQGIEDREMQVLQVKDLEWEEDCEFIYTPFLIIVRRNSQLYAHIEFGEEGFISHVKRFEEGQLAKVYIFDDRGFISSVVVYEAGRPLYQDYLNPEGDWRVRESLVKDYTFVKVNPQYAADFKQERYESMQDLIFEKFRLYLVQHVYERDKFVLAANRAHNVPIMALLPKNIEKILSFFVERNQEDNLDNLAFALEHASLVLVDRADFQERLSNRYPDLAYKIHQVSSYDTRLQLGKSQRKREAKIYYQINSSEILNDYAIFKVLQFVAQYPLTELTVGVFNEQGEGLQRVEAKIEEVISSYLKKEDFAKVKEMSKGAENALEENQEISYRYQVKNITDELSLIQELEYTRLIVDLNDEPNLYTQIAGISAGIPQINLKSSEYVSHLKNGYILKEISEFPKAAHYYLDGLKQWNQSLIYSIDKIRENTGAKLIYKWEKWLEEAKHGN